MTNLSTSVLIVTKDRPLFLKRCLESLVQQSVLPNQVVVVDNGSGTAVKKIISDFKEYFKITYAKEFRKGEAFARNKAIKKSREEILAFIDDDCVADKNWLKNILFCFKNEFKCDGVLGKSENYLKDNPFACIYQCYYLRWLMENFQDIKRIQPTRKGNNFFDTKNVAMKGGLVKKFFFEPDVLFRNIIVDTVAGNVLLKKGKFFYNPKIVVYHQNWDSFKKLIENNFHQGIGEQLVFNVDGIDARRKLLKYSYFKWLKMCSKEADDLNILKKIFFWTLLFIYPLPYRIGRLVYKFKR